jgi:hypothetical protein
VPAGAGDQDHASAGALEQGRQELGGEAKWPRWFTASWVSNPSVVRCSGMPITPALLMRKSILGWSARIDAAALRTEASDRPKVERLQLQEGVRELAADRRDGRLRLGLVAGRHHNLAAPAGQFPGHLQPELTVGAGHHRDPAQLIGDVRGGPGHTRCYAGGWCKRVGCSCSGCRRAGQGCSKQHEQAGCYPGSLAARTSTGSITGGCAKSSGAWVIRAAAT